MALAASALLCSPNVDAAELEDRAWLQSRVGSITVYSMRNMQRTQEFVEDIEIFRQVALQLTGIDLAASPIPVEIFAIGGVWAPSRFGLKGSAAGSMHVGQRKLQIVVNDVYDQRDLDFAWHQLLHFMISNSRVGSFPLWLLEGNIEYFGSMRFNSKDVSIGHSPEYILPVYRESGGGAYSPDSNSQNRRLDWVYLDEVIARQPDDDWPTRSDRHFFAQSWALVHFLRNLPETDLSFNQQFVMYTEQVEANGDPVQSFSAVFGVSTTTLDEELPEYINSKRLQGLRIPIAPLLEGFKPTQRYLKPAEISILLAEVAEQRGDYERVEYWLEVANSDEALAGRVAAHRGIALQRQGQSEAALDLFETALQLAPEDPYVRLDAANYWLHRISAAEPSADKEELYANARAQVVKAQQLAPLMPEGFAVYGKILLQADREHGHALVLLQQAQRLLPGDIEINEALAEAYRAVGRVDEADELAEIVQQMKATARSSDRLHHAINDIREYN